MRCGQIVTENICMAVNANSNRCTFKTVTLINIKTSTVCSENDIALMNYEEYLEPFPKLDHVTVGTVFSIGFTTVLLCYLIARGVGVVLNLIRTG